MPDYASMSIDDLNKELSKKDLLTEDRSAIIYAIAKKIASPEEKAPTIAPTSSK